MEEDGMGFAGVGSPEKDHIGFFDLLIAGGSTTGTEHCRQTDDRRSVSGSVTGVDVVGSEHRSTELLGCVVHLIGGLGTTEHGEATMPTIGKRRIESRDRPIECLVPSGGPECPVMSDQGLGQTR